MTTAAAAAKVNETEPPKWPIDQIDSSPTNPRKYFDPVKLKELAESIKEQGVLQAVVARLRNGRAQLIFGERRWRASKMAGLKEIPLVFRDMTDEEVIKAQLVENAQRADTHPLEEADSIKLLHDPPKGATYKPYSVDRIAHEIGKSPSHVYQRLKLCALGEDGRQALLENKIDTTTAVAIARIPTMEMQKKATKEIVTGHGGQPMTFREADQHIKTRYMLQLAGAPFDTKDKALYPEAGNCSDCPKRTGNQKELFADVSRADVCTDPSCYQVKVTNHWKALAAKAEEKGHKVLGDKEAAKVFPYGNNQVAPDSGYASIDDTCPEDPKRRSYKQLLGKKAHVTVARSPATGDVITLVERKDMKAQLKEAGHEFKPPTLSTMKGGSQRGAGGADLAAKRERERQERRQAVIKAVMGAVIASATGTTAFWRLLLRVLVSQGFSDAAAQVVKRRGWKAEKGGRGIDAILDKIDSLDSGEAARLVLELVLSRGAYFQFSDGIDKHLLEAAKVFGVNVKKVKGQIEKEHAAAAKAKKPPKKKEK